MVFWQGQNYHVSVNCGASVVPVVLAAEARIAGCSGSPGGGRAGRQRTRPNALPPPAPRNAEIQ